MQSPRSLSRPASAWGSAALHVLLTSAFLTNGSSAISEDEKRAVRPFVTKGDTWTYRTISTVWQASNKVELETFTVTVVNEELGIIHADVDRRAEGAKENPEPELNGIWTNEWNAKIITRPGISKGTIVQPHGGAFKFPMKVGDAYDTNYEITTATKDGPGSAFKVRRKTSVARWEEVTVPAGKFAAFVIESDGTVEQIGGGKTWRMAAKYWYSPEVRRMVKYTQEHWPDDLVGELISYKLSDVQ